MKSLGIVQVFYSFIISMILVVFFYSPNIIRENYTYATILNPCMGATCDEANGLKYHDYCQGVHCHCCYIKFSESGDKKV